MPLYLDIGPALDLNVAVNFHIGILHESYIGALVYYEAGIAAEQLEQAIAMGTADALRADIFEIGGATLGAFIRFDHLSYSTPKTNDLDIGNKTVLVPHEGRPERDRVRP